MATNKNLTKNIVRNEDGTVNVEETRTKYGVHLLSVYQTSMDAAEKKFTKDHDDGLVAFEADLATYCEQRGQWDVISAEYIKAQFARLPPSLTGGTITKPTLISMSVGGMVSDGRITFGQYELAAEMCAAYIDDANGVTLDVTKGKNGGVRLKK